LDPNVGAKAQQLAQALSTISPALGRFGATLQARSNERNLQEGQIAAAEAARQGLSFKEAVDKGVLKRTDNPFFVRGAKEQFGRIAADRMHTDLAVNLEEALKDVSEPGEVLAALDDAQRTWMSQNVGEGTEGEFQTGFSLRAAAHMEQLRGQLLSRASKNFEDRSKSALFAEARKHIADTSKSFSIQEVAADLNQLVADEIAKGSNPKDVDDAVLKAVGQTMMEKDGRDVSELFDLVKGSSGLSLRDVFGEKSSEYVRGVINNHHNLWRQNQRDKLEDERIREQDVRDQAADETIRFLMQNPSAPIDSIVRKYANERGAIASIANAAKQVYEVNAVEDPEIAEELYIEVYSGNLRKSAVMDRLAKGEFRLSTAAKAVQWIRQRDGEERALAAQARGESRADHQIRDQARRERLALITDPQLRSAISNLKAKFADESKPWITKDAAKRREYAQAQMVAEWLKWKETDEGATADLSTTNEWLFRTSTAIEQGQWNEAVGGPYSGKKGAVPTTLEPVSRSGGASGGDATSSLGSNRKLPVLSPADIQSVVNTNQASAAVRRAAQAAGVNPSDPNAVMDFVEQQSKLYPPGTIKPAVIDARPLSQQRFDDTIASRVQKLGNRSQPE
jgi:hypothetical protein